MTERTTIRIPGFRGEVITPEHQEYGGARAVWNGAVDRRPRMIARCSGTADVATAARFARYRELDIAVRGGGHNVAGTAVCDDGIVIDLSRCAPSWLIPSSARPWSRAVPYGETSTTRHWRTAWPPRAAS